ncbi:hypothetical protein AX16_005013 [Volvariella volvacea WC 439]|nr:hypothetical protein AX16_005013 [Volvariella volvacea WC 439]
MRTIGITVELSASSSSVASVDDLILTAAVTNMGSEDIKIPKYGTVLDESLPTKSFKVSKDGHVVPFTGAQVQIYFENFDDASFVIVPAGETVTFNIMVISALYDFESVGTGKFVFEPNAHFFSVFGANYGVPVPLPSKIDYIPSSIEVEITSDVAYRHLHEVNEHAVTDCDSQRRAFIDTSYAEARSLASGASTHIKNGGASDPLYKAYFGANPISNVTAIFDGLANQNSSITLSCTDPFLLCGPNVITYTMTHTIYFCPTFFSQVPLTQLCSGTSYNVRGVTILHELTHVLYGTIDGVYSCQAAQILPDPRKLTNADNYNCFATQVYVDTVC